MTLIVFCQRSCIIQDSEVREWCIDAHHHHFQLWTADYGSKSEMNNHMNELCKKKQVTWMLPPQLQPELVG